MKSKNVLFGCLVMEGMRGAVYVCTLFVLVVQVCSCSSKLVPGSNY